MTLQKSMSKIVTVVTSSDEKDCTYRIVQRIMDGAMGLSLNTFELVMTKNFRYISGCDQCGRCKKTGHCIINDDIAPLLDSIRDCDSLILATPLIFGDMTAQMKTVIDRFTSFLNADGTPNIPAGKKIAIVVSCTKNEKANAEHVIHLLKDVMVNTLKFELVGTILYTGVGSSVPDPVLDEARVIGNALTS
jgi:multimeric flavodoxin WrbA